MVEQESVRSQVMETLDGDGTNLAASNLRMTDTIHYQCQMCLSMEILQEPPIVMHDEHFKQGYAIGIAEAKRWEDLDDLTDEEVVNSLKRTFADHASEGNEEALRSCSGSTIGLLVGMAIMPTIDAYKEIQAHS